VFSLLKIWLFRPKQVTDFTRRSSLTFLLPICYMKLHILRYRIERKLMFT